MSKERSPAQIAAVEKMRLAREAKKQPPVQEGDETGTDEQQGAEEGDDKGDEKPEPIVGAVHEAAGGRALRADEMTGDTVTMVFPKRVKLTDDKHRHMDFPQGINEVPAEHADHWWLKANGVQAYVKD